VRPPGRAAGDERAQVFVSALEQAEQLMTAAEAVGPAARPLPLFYSLSQAGRGIAAARLPDPWRLAGHGLSVPTKDATSLLRRVAKPESKQPAKDRRHAFVGVAEATGSGQLIASVELGAVWAAIPHLLEQVAQPPLDNMAWRRPLRVYLTEWAHAEYPLVTQAPAALKIDGLSDGANVEQVCRELAEYPAAAGAMPAAVRDGADSPVMTERSPDGRMLPRVEWPIEPRGPSGWADRLEGVAPGVVSVGAAYLLPRLAGRDFLSPLMLWWVLLFGLSSVARYDPELWVAELDVNHSPTAVPIEAALDAAIEAVPELVLDALTQ
jgi:hypothetical protein